MTTVPGSAAPAERRARFEALAALAYEPLQRYVGRRLRAGGADDVVADSLLVLWRRLDDVPAGAELAWCYGVARRCLANHRRAGERQIQLAVKMAGQHDAAVAAEPFDSELDPELAAALARLAEHDRELVELWAWEGLEPRELAVVLDTTANAVSIRLHRLRRRLAAELAAELTDQARKDEPPAGQSGVSPAMEEER